LADQATAVFSGISRALDVLALLVNDPGQSRRRRRGAPLRVPDWLPALLNAARVFVVIGAVELFWVVTAWPDGASAITFAALAVTLFSPRAEQAYVTAMRFMTGVSIATVVAAIVKFALLPNVETYVTYCLATGLVLVPAGALMAQPRHTVIFLATAVLFNPLLAPANPMSYDTQEFYNSALAIVSVVGVAVLSFRLIPPVPPALRTRRLLRLTLRDLRRLTHGPIAATTQDWESRTMARVAVLPDAAAPVERSRLLAALSLGTEIIRLRRIARRLDFETALAPMLRAIAAGESELATAHLAALDRLLADMPPGWASEWVRMRSRASLLAMSEALAQHSAYFGDGESR
ncbi:MAG: FUSC family protein, partial [Alphaproteobacteria bacterium]|nr:FUSC family protein [Alphaproteobacteria bacterium]